MKDPDICNAQGCSLYKFGDSKYCNYHRGMYSEKKPKEKKIDKFNPYKFKSEKPMFDYIFKTRPRTCIVTGEDLTKYNNTDFYPNLFLHILSKGKAFYPEFKLYINNIALGTPGVHRLFDQGSLDQVLRFEKDNGCSFDVLFDLERLVYNEHVKEFGKRRPMRKIVGLYFKAKKGSETTH